LNVLVVDDDPNVLAYVDGVLRKCHRVTTCADGGTALARLERQAFDVVLTDLRMPAPDGFDILRAAQALDPPVPVIVLTAVDSARAAVRALRLGARDFLVKPADGEEIAGAIAAVKDRVAGSQAPRRSSSGDDGLVGDSAPMQLVRRLIPALAQSRETVLILGETGTGKELLARAVHTRGPRSKRPFVAHNMAATPADLAESIFFGHMRGAFSGASSDHLGLFEQANGGTLFLDEVDSFPFALQAKLLRVLESGNVRRVGSEVGRSFDVRVVAATATELSDQVAAGAFRADLYYRLKQLEVALPPLRERRGDIPCLVGQFLAELEAETHLKRRMEAEAMDRLLAHGWPGNVRELRNVVRSAAVMANADAIGLAHLPAPLRCTREATSPSCLGSLRSFELQHIFDTLDRVGGNQSEAARILGIDRGTLARKLAGVPRDKRRT
jgi:two-component system NtrC family response regulator